MNDSIQFKAQKLKELYKKAVYSKNIVYKKEFFYAFPNTFKELKELYGYNNDTAAILYDEYENHIINLFNTLDDIIADTLYYKKIISIAICGHWDADAIGAFQYGLRNKVLANLNLSTYLLQNMSDGQVKSFWYFYFDGPQPVKEIPDKLSMVKRIDMRVYELMVTSLKNVQRSWRDY